MPLRLQKYLSENKPATIVPISQTIGFIIVRCIINEMTSKYWLKSYHCIRKFYPKHSIVIIDDNSDPKYVNPSLEKNLERCLIIHSKKPKRGEMLAYYYFYKHHWFERAVILHDSVFLKRPIEDLLSQEQPVRFLWHFETKVYDDVELERKLLATLGEPYLQLYNKKDEWKGCFGVMSIIDFSFLKKISHLFVLLDDIQSRRHRSCIERIFAIMCFYHFPQLAQKCSVMGDILTSYPLGWGYDYRTFEADEKNACITFPPLVKVWTGR